MCRAETDLKFKSSACQCRNIDATLSNYNTWVVGIVGSVDKLICSKVENRGYT